MTKPLSMSQNLSRKNSEESIHVKHVFVEHLPVDLEEVVIYIVRGFFAAHNCLCGCKKRIVMPLCKNGWQLSENHGMISFYPSIENHQFPCRSHYRITNSVVHFITKKKRELL